MPQMKEIIFKKKKKWAKKKKIYEMTTSPAKTQNKSLNHIQREREFNNPTTKGIEPQKGACG